MDEGVHSRETMMRTRRLHCPRWRNNRRKLLGTLSSREKKHVVGFVGRHTEEADTRRGEKKKTNQLKPRVLTWRVSHKIIPAPLRLLLDIAVDHRHCPRVNQRGSLNIDFLQFAWGMCEQIPTVSIALHRSHEMSREEFAIKASHFPIDDFQRQSMIHRIINRKIIRSTKEVPDAKALGA